jgi:hypothetical protein
MFILGMSSIAGLGVPRTDTFNVAVRRGKVGTRNCLVARQELLTRIGNGRVVEQGGINGGNVGRASRDISINASVVAIV